ncbi:MAG: ribonuclease HI [Sulfurimonas sp.]|jgi:ribonuclease HI|uniref:ribonuclease HI n=1 Tax=Sulfurimonas sp. TaxID=2022749 RepID=UPI0039E397B8
MSNSKKISYLFTDGSVNPQSEIGFGAYLFLQNEEFFCAELAKEIKIKKFDNTSSTKLELETLLWALGEVSLQNCKVVVYTDCQNIIGLSARREGFQKKNYMTSKGKLIKNHALYKDFFKKIDILDCEFIKVKGHKKSSQKNNIDEIFTLVDKASRNALRIMKFSSS